MKNELSLAITQVAKGKGVIFDETAQHNRVNVRNTEFGFENHAPLGGNRIVTSDLMSIQSPEVPESGAELVNPIPADVEVLVLDPGKATGWSLTELGGEATFFEIPWTAGQQIRLQSGDAISVKYDGAKPKWRWRVVP